MKIKKDKQGSNDEKYKIKEMKIKQILKDKYNKKCFDCKIGNPDNISLFNGIFICNNCTKNIHNKLNSNISLITENDLYKLSLKGIQYLYFGGNKKLFDFVNYEYPILKSINKKKFYMTKAMYYYRRWLKYLVNGGNKPLKPPYEECYKVDERDNINNLEKKEKIQKAILSIELDNYNFTRDKNISQIEKPLIKRKKKGVINFHNNSKNKIQSLILDNKNNNYFYLPENNQLNIQTINKNSTHNFYKTNSISSRLNYSNSENNKIYSKPNLLTSTFFHKGSVSFTKERKINKNEFNIHNSIIFPNKNNNYILLNNNTYNNSLTNNIFSNSQIYRNSLNPQNQRYGRNVHNTFLSSFQIMNNSIYSDDINKTSIIFKKKNLKNSFSISAKNKKKKKNILRQESIESNRFQIIPKLNLEKKMKKKRKPIIINLKEKPKNNEDDKYFTFYTKKDIKSQEKDNNNEKQIINNINKVQNMTKKMNINKLLNLIIEMKKKHKIKINPDLNSNINKHYFLKQKNKSREIKQNINDKSNNVNNNYI